MANDYSTPNLCGCGCGQSVAVSKRFIKHHHQRTRRKPESARYLMTYAPNHPRAHGSGRVVATHILIAEKALGKPLPPKAQVHHVDGNKHNNANKYLVICPDMAYHGLLHRLDRILKAGGDPHRDRICGHCKAIKPATVFSSGICGLCIRSRRAVLRLQEVGSMEIDKSTGRRYLRPAMEKLRRLIADGKTVEEIEVLTGLHIEWPGVVKTDAEKKAV